MLATVFFCKEHPQKWMLEHSNLKWLLPYVFEEHSSKWVISYDTHDYIKALKQ